MKLNINAKELLALYNLLHAKVEAGQEAGDEGDDVQLRQVYNRLRAIIVAGLTSKAVDPVDSWLKHEQEKIDDLNQQNEQLREVAKDPAQFAPVQPGSILTDDDDEVPNDLGYPKSRKGAPPPNAPRPGKYHGRRK
jgi:hypothetical protein